jgi:hypothetical protein
MLYIGPAGPHIPAERSNSEDNSLETRLNNARSRAHREAIEAHGISASLTNRGTRGPYLESGERLDAVLAHHLRRDFA